MTLACKNLTIGTRLRDINVSLEPGQITAICGPNGAGKSTLLTALAGLLGAATGEVKLGGTPLTAMSPKRRAQQIGYLPQDGEVAWDVSVRSLIALGRLPHGDADPAPVNAAIQALGLEAFAERPVSKISGGERARALLGRVLAGQPEWILADEPLAALDLAHQLTLLREFRVQADGGVGVIIVVHDLALAMNHADRVIVLDQGSVSSQGSPQNALPEQMINEVWGVDMRWIGEPGAQALVQG